MVGRFDPRKKAAWLVQKNCWISGGKYMKNHENTTMINNVTEANQLGHQAKFVCFKAPPDLSFSGSKDRLTMHTIHSYPIFWFYQPQTPPKIPLNSGNLWQKKQLWSSNDILEQSPNAYIIFVGFVGWRSPNSHGSPKPGSTRLEPPALWSFHRKPSALEPQVLCCETRKCRCVGECNDVNVKAWNTFMIHYMDRPKPNYKGNMYEERLGFLNLEVGKWWFDKCTCPFTFQVGQFRTCVLKCWLKKDLE